MEKYRHDESFAIALNKHVPFPNQTQNRHKTDKFLQKVKRQLSPKELRQIHHPLSQKSKYTKIRIPKKNLFLKKLNKHFDLPKTRSISTRKKLSKTHKRVHSHILSQDTKSKMEPKISNNKHSPLCFRNQVILEKEESEEKEEVKFNQSITIDKRDSLSCSSIKFDSVNHSGIKQISKNFIIKRNVNHHESLQPRQKNTRNLANPEPLNQWRMLKKNAFKSMDERDSLTSISPKKKRARRNFNFSHVRKKTPIKFMRDEKVQKSVISPEPERRDLFQSMHSGDLNSQQSNNVSSSSIGRYEVDMKDRMDTYDSRSSIIGELKEDFMNAGNSKMFNERMFEDLQKRIFLPRFIKGKKKNLAKVYHKKPKSNDNPIYFMGTQVPNKIKKNLPLKNQINLIIFRNQYLKMIKQRKNEFMKEYIERIGK
ncbi:unnamed protein product [Moneuplotes crassus]|uniref:Uncharacterized protein n=1 Tax=Euplotes crassus TaxID=5936 RepID=A0AAD1UNB9_EUPCR|nr:unnamed protein product [Moneuplotes crassus]